MKIEIYPLEKVIIDNNEIYFDMDRLTIEKLLGPGELCGNRYYYFNDELAIDYDNNKVAFIEFLAGNEGKLRPYIYGVSIFDTKADELAQLLKENNNGAIDEPEQGYSMSFVELSIGLYREIRPVDVQEMIEERLAEGISIGDDVDLISDIKRADYWATIGVGKKDYYKS